METARSLDIVDAELSKCVLHIDKVLVDAGQSVSISQVDSSTIQPDLDMLVWFRDGGLLVRSNQQSRGALPAD